MQQARAQIEKSGSMLPPAEGQAPAAIQPPAGQPRDEQGRFTGDPAAAPAEGEQPPAEGDQPAAEEPVAADDNVAGSDDSLIVELPGRRPEDPAVAIEAKTPEEAERLRQLVNGYQRGAELQQRAALVDRDREALAMVEARLELDPEGFLFENIPKARAADVALQVLLEPDVWSSVSDIITELAESDEKREYVRTSLENQRLKNRQTAETRLVERQEAARSAQDVKRVCAMLVPDHLPEQDQIALYQSLQQEVATHADRLGLTRLDPRDVPLIVARRLREAGVDPVTAASALFTRSSGNAPKNGRTPAAAPPARPAQPKSPTGQQFVDAQKRVRAVATGVPAGSGAPSSAAVPPPPSGQTLEQRIEWARRNLSFSS
jgi:type II secretory pathway component PulJ